MTSRHPDVEHPAGTDYESLASRFRPIFAEIARDAAARTVTSHNPLVYKARIVGDWTINGTKPPFVWRVGQGPNHGSK
jgi:hypothetical protein